MTKTVIIIMMMPDVGYDSFDDWPQDEHDNTIYDHQQGAATKTSVKWQQHHDERRWGEQIKEVFEDKQLW